MDRISHPALLASMHDHAELLAYTDETESGRPRATEMHGPLESLVAIATRIRLPNVNETSPSDALELLRTLDYAQKE